MYMYMSPYCIVIGAGRKVLEMMILSYKFYLTNFMLKLLNYANCVLCCNFFSVKFTLTSSNTSTCSPVSPHKILKRFLLFFSFLFFQVRLCPLLSYSKRMFQSDCNAHVM